MAAVLALPALSAGASATSSAASRRGAWPSSPCSRCRRPSGSSAFSRGRCSPGDPFPGIAELAPAAAGGIAADRPRRALPRHGDRRDGDRRSDLGGRRRSSRSRSTRRGETCPDPLQWLGIGARRRRHRRRSPGSRARTDSVASPPAPGSPSSRRSASACSSSASTPAPTRAPRGPSRGAPRRGSGRRRRRPRDLDDPQADLARLLPLIVGVGVFDTGANVLVRGAPRPRAVGIVAVLSSLYPIVDDRARLARPRRAARARRSGSADSSRSRAPRSSPRGERAPRRAMLGLDVEADVEHVAVLDDVGLALEPLQPALRRPRRASPHSRRSSQRITSQRMKPRAMSEWIVPAASSAVWPRRSVQARVSLSPTVKNVIRPSASLSRTTTSSSADAPVAELGRLLVGELGELRLELAVDPTRAVLERDQRLRRERLELGGQLVRPVRERLAGVEVGEQALERLDLLALGAIAGLRLLLHALEPALDVVAVGDEQLELAASRGRPQGRLLGEPVQRPRAARRPGGARRGAARRCRARRRRGSRPA